MRHLVLSFLAFTALTGLARAADLAAVPVALPVPAPSAFNWAGAYGGLQLGGTFGQTNVYIAGARFNTNVDNGGVFGGAHAGYNFQIQNYVLGVEGEFNVVSNKAQTTQLLGATYYTASVYSNWSASVGARAGFIWKNALIYAIGGYSFLNNGTTIYGNGAELTGQTQSLNGFNVGGGVEYGFTPNWSGRLEYRYYGYDSVTNNFVNSTRTFSERPTASTVRAGVSYHWQPAETVAAVAKY